jgi:lipoprotein-anchoring transpeptidase ErfK/SrfK
MYRVVLSALTASALCLPVNAEPLSLRQEPAPVRVAAAGDMGGGFIELLFGGNRGPQVDPRFAPQYGRQPEPQQQDLQAEQRRAMDPKFQKQLVDYHGPEKPGTIIISTRDKFLYLVQEDGKAMRYGVGVGREGFLWSGTKAISRKREWPDWTPPAEMLQRRPDLPRHMEGGPDNPLGARAMYLGDSLYRIHGSNEPWTIGTNVSSGCIRMRNEDVTDLYERVKVGTRVVVI